MKLSLWGLLCILAFVSVSDAESNKPIGRTPAQTDASGKKVGQTLNASLYKITDSDNGTTCYVLFSNIITNPIASTMQCFEKK